MGFGGVVWARVKVVVKAEALAKGRGEGSAPCVALLFLLNGVPQCGAMPAGCLAVGKQAGWAVDECLAPDDGELGGHEATRRGSGKQTGECHAAEQESVGATQGECAPVALPYYGIHVEPF